MEELAMQHIALSLKFWERVFIASLALYIVDDIFLFSIFYVTIPLTFFIGVVTCIFALKNKAYLHAVLCMVGTLFPIFRFMLMPY